MAPSLAGIVARCLMGDGPIRRIKPGLKLANSIVLLVLCYANAALALPKTFANPDWDFLIVMLVIVSSAKPIKRL